MAYIDKNKLGIGKCNPDVFENKGYAKGWNSAIEIIENQPAADVVKVKHGYWIDGKCGYYKICSECNQIADFYFDYCPNCGAKMDGKDGE